VDASLSVSEVADRAGVPEAFVEALAAAGALERSVDALDGGSVRRAMLLSACVDAGLPLEAISTAMRSGHLTLETVDRPYYERWGGRIDTTWERLSAETGVPLDFIRQAYEAAGFAVPERSDHPRADDAEMIEVTRVALGGGFAPEAMVRLMRVYGESMRRIARTETQMWHEFVDVPAERAGATQREILAAGATFGQAILSVIDGFTLSIYHRMQEHAWMNDMVEHIELALVEAGVYERPARPWTMAFMDLSGYTALTEERGDEAAADLVTALAAIVQRVASRHGGEAMKFLGDGVMFRFRDAASAVRGALHVVEQTHPAGLPPAHVGMHTGALIERDGDVFGRTVNLASRLSGRAGPGEVLVTSDIVEAVDGAGDIRFDALGPTTLKGVADPIEVFRAVPAASGG
jgi:adenylate cyclase